MQIKGSGRKELIIALIKIYKKQFPVEYKAIVENIAKIRETRTNKFGNIDNTKDDVEFRWSLRIPKRLDQMVNGFLNIPHEPKFLEEKKEINWFANEFPEFKTSEKI